ncbi:hypothetical protein UlMin_041917 [Ulmus minor]
MAASSSAAAAADSRPPKYDVFISFRGEDTRKGFTSHLYSELSRKQIEAYIDQVSLEKGDTISRALPEAIKESEISIIIFSKNYVASRWCLDELVHILKRREEKDQIVLPIFYNIDPSNIRNQKGTYAAAFKKHEERFQMEKVQKWRQALTEAASLSGWDSRNMPDDSALVKEVAERVRTELDTLKSKRKRKRSDDFKGLVGIPERLEKIKSFLDSPAVRVVGIWGIGGIGKTTLAKAVFDRFYDDFEGSYFAPSVRENAINKGFDTLKKEVYSELLGDKKLDTSKSSAVDDRLSRKRILLVLDDVENPMQFEDLVGDLDRFCRGSKIIVTSRHKLKVDEEYKVEVLDSYDACKLFYLKAFGHEESCRRGFEGISGRVVEYTKGHPLALKVLGASVFCFLESIEDWGNELEKLKRILNDDIQDVLKRSYNALDDEEKGLFLDIACFFKGQRRDFVDGILEGKPFTGLVKKSLITIEDGRICMHDLIQEMGRDIVRQSSAIPGERSRLWIAKDVSFMLENNRGTEAIEGISLPWIDQLVRLRPDAFEKMCKLRLLKIYDARQHQRCGGKVEVYINGDLKYLPNGLRYLRWEHYHGRSLPSNFKPDNLVELHMPHSKLEKLWDGVQELGSLKHIDLHRSKLLKEIPDLSRAPKLESINLSDCPSLIHIPSLHIQATLNESTYRHQRLRVNYESRDEITPGCIILRGYHLTTLPEVSGNIRKLVSSGKALKELPSSIESLENLLLLDLRNSSEFKSLPKLSRNIEVLVLDGSGIEQIPSSSIECLCSLRILSLAHCPHLESLPMLSGLRCLTELDLRFCNIREIPACIGMLYKLKKLDISYCKNLQSLPELPLFIESVNARGCSSLEMVSTLRSTLTLGRWLDEYDSDGDNYHREFSFENCTKLGEDAISNIFTEFLVIGKVVVCYPTKEIPRWFNNQSEGSSITIPLPPNWYNPKTFLGFVVFVVVTKKANSERCVECILHLMTAGDRFRVDEDYGYNCPFISGEHSVMWYNYFDHSKINFEKEYKEALFEFESSSNLKVERCGVRMLYLRDAVEKSDNGTAANFESWRIDVNDSDSAK